MNCLRAKYPTFNYYLNYIEYLVNPMSFDSKFYPNITSPYFSLKIFNENGEEISLTECPSNSLIKITMPFNAYDWLNYINEQKWLFLPENYKLEDDSVFRDPILIRDDGSISDDTVEERIKTYYRYYNIVGLVYTPNQINLYEYSSVLFKNISDAFFLLFETNHLSGFSSMLIPNPMKFIVDNRFFYLPRYMVLFFIENHFYNPVFYLNTVLFIAFVIICIAFKFKDFNYFDNLETLDFLVKEVYKNNFGYNQIDPGINDANIYKLINHINRDLRLNNNKEIRGMFDQYEFEDIKEDLEEDEKDENKKENNINTITGKKLMALNDNNYKNKKSINFDSESDNQTELKTNKKRKKTGRKQENKKSNKSSPPPKKKNKMETIITNDDIDNNSNNNSEDSSPKNITKVIDIAKRRRSQMSKNNDNDKGYNENEEEDFDENKLEKVLSSEKSSNKPRFVGFSQVNQNYDIATINSKQNLNSSKYSKFSRLSKQSKKSYFVDKNNTRPNKYISIEKFHNKSYKLNINKNIFNYDEEKKIALDEYTRLNNTTFEFFKYNLKTRHLLISPFSNLTLYHNRWKKLITLLTQFFLEELFLSILLTNDENILLSNISKMIVASLLAMIISNLLVHLIIPFFVMTFYERKKIYRYAEKGENLYVYKIWCELNNKMNIKTIFAIIIIVIFWILNFYITLGFTAVWKVQRVAFIVCFFITIVLDLVVGEIIMEGICALLYSKRKKYNLIRNIGEMFNRYRSYRTFYP